MFQNIFQEFPKISEDVQRFPKIAKDIPGIPEDVSMKQQISYPLGYQRSGNINAPIIQHRYQCLVI